MELFPAKSPQSVTESRTSRTRSTLLRAYHCVRNIERATHRLPIVSCDYLPGLARLERQHILAVLTQTHFDKKEAARRLGISLTSLYRKIGEHAIQANDN